MGNGDASMVSPKVQSRYFEFVHLTCPPSSVALALDVQLLACVSEPSLRVGRQLTIPRCYAMLAE